MSRTSRQTASIISTYASDASGVASALYELGGMTVIHDASGCNSTYNTHDEPRWYDMDSMVYISAVSEMEAIMGDDSRWVSDIIDTALELKPNFIALAGSPIPMMIGTDFEALAFEIEEATGIPTFGIPTNGMHSYIWGVSQAFACLAHRIVEAPRLIEHTAGRIRVNLLGLTPLDFSVGGMDRSLMQVLEGHGIEITSRWAMGDTLEHIRHASEADVDLVVSESGMAAAKILKERFGIPWVVGLPFGPSQTEDLCEALRLAAADHVDRFVSEPALEGDVVIIGEGIQSLSLAEKLRREQELKVKVVCATEPRQPVASRVIAARDEEEILPHLEKAAMVIADPLYKPIVPADSTFIPWPHEGFSGRIYRTEIPDLIRDGLEG